MKGSGDGDLKIAISDAFLNMVQRQRRYAQTDGPAEICSNGWHQWIQRSNRSSYLIDVLTVDEGVSQIGGVFEYVATPSGDMLKRMAQRRYAQTDGTSGFSASNRSSCPLDRRSDCR